MHSTTAAAALPEGPAREALCRAAADVVAAEAAGRPFTMSQALAQLARCYRGLGAADAAEAAYLQALRWSRLVGSADAVVELLCDLCELAASQAELLDNGDRDSGRGRTARALARGHAFEAGQLAGSVADSRWEVQVLLRISDVLERCGDRDDAAALQLRALRLINGEAAARLDPALLPGALAG